MANPQPCIGNKLTGGISPYHNVQPKLKAQAGYSRMNVVLYNILYIYYNEVRRDELME